MNLVMVRACNNSCPYCFEAGERQRGKQGYISPENFAQFTKWARSAGLEYLSFLGGEPFLHPDLGEMIKQFRQVSPMTGLNILTGGIFNKHLLDTLSPNVVALVFNINEPRDYKNPKHFTKVLRNVELAIRKGFVVGLGFNVWRPDFDTSFMPNLAYRFGRSSFRWTIANPQLNTPSNVVQPHDFNAVAERCVTMLKEAASLGIEAMLDCSLPLCFFNEADLAWVRQYHSGTASRLGICEPILDVTPELEVIRCFALSSTDRKKITDFRNEQEIRKWFLNNIDSALRGKGCFPHCTECVHYQEGRCQGGCLAWHDGIAEKDAPSNPRQLADTMNSAIQSGHPELALEQYDASIRPLKTAETTFTAAFSAVQLGKWSQAFRYAAYAQDITTNIELKKRINELMTEIPSRDSDETTDQNKKLDSVPFVSCPRADDGVAIP